MLVVDTSVVVKWTVMEAGSDDATGLVGRALIAPDLLQAELGSVLTKKVRRGEIRAEQAREAFTASLDLVRMMPSPSFAGAALELSLDLEHAIYDCYFLAMAQAYGSFLVTADRAFLEKVRATRLAPLVLQLGDEVPHV
jgi:predicted nucleic acid-binding protein